MSRLSSDRLAELAAFCVEMSETRRELQPWSDLAAACEQLFDLRRRIDEVADHYEALLPAVQSGDRARVDALLERGKRVGR